MATKKHFKLSLRSNFGVINNVKLAKLKNLKAIALVNIGKLMRIYVEDAKQSIEDRVSNIARNRVDGGTTLADAYKLAARSQITGDHGSSRLTANFLDSKMLDTLLPRSREEDNARYGGWWRIHEYGSPGLVGGSTEYGFMSKEHLQKILGERLIEPVGRHDEGIMVHKDSPLARVKNFQTFKGVKPFRIVTAAQSRFEANLATMRRQVAQAMFESLR